jgi:hypothetical protein
VTASSEGYTTVHRDLDVAGARDERVTLELVAAASKERVAPAFEAPLPRATAEKPHGSGRRTAAFIVGSVGVAALSTGAVFGARAIAKSRESNDLCPSRDCPDAQALSANSDARLAANIANVAIGAGLVGIGVMTYLLLTSATSATPTANASAPQRTNASVRAPALRLEPTVGRSQAWLVLAGTW